MKNSVTKKDLCSFILLLCFFKVISQVGIGTTNPDGSSVLHIDSTDKGILIPQIALTGTDDINTVNNPALSLLIFNTNTTTGVNSVREGFYYWDGMKWVGLANIGSTSASQGWLTSGNLGTNPSNNFVGTLDNEVLMFRTNNIERIEFSHKSQIEYFNNGNSVFLGQGAGENDDLTDNRNVYIGKSSIGIPNSEGNVLIGYEAKANSNYAIALGYSAESNFDNSIAIGRASKSDAEAAIAIGWLTNSNFSNAVAIGRSASANQDASIAIGEVAHVSGINSIAIGKNAIALKDNGIALGLNGYASDQYGVSIGANSRAVTASTTAVGHNAVADAIGASAYGLNSHANNTNALALGMASKSEALNAIAIGANSSVTSNGDNGIAIGTGSSADGTNAAAYGSGVVAYSNQIRMGGYYITSIGGPTNWTNISDSRFKFNIKDNVPGLEFIKKLRPITYQLNTKKYATYMGMPDYLKNEVHELAKSAEIQSGFLAQDVERAANELGYDFSGVDKPDNEKDTYGLRYAAFVVPLVKAVQELEEKVNILSKKVSELEATNKILKEQLSTTIHP